MLQTLADMLDDSDNSRLSAWVRTVFDFPINVTKQNMIFAGGIMLHETPAYVKRNSVVSGSLIAPFFILVIVNSISSHALDFTNSWKTLFVWLVVGLPALALALSLATFLKWSRQKKSFWHSLFDLRRNWMIIVTGIVALLIVLFVPFHDSTKCINGNPVRELKHLHETWQCIQQRG